MKSMPQFFYGAATPKGFRSLFPEIYDTDWRVYILKGGPGTGKSTLMKQIADKRSGEQIVYAPCASDPVSVDAVIFPDSRQCIIDGTAPHILEPEYPGVCEQLVDLGSCWTGEKLRKNKAQILELFSQYKSEHARAGRYINAIGTLLCDNHKLALSAADVAKTGCYAASLARHEFPKKKINDGSETKCFLSAVTPDGHIVLEETVHTLCDTVIAVEDDYGAVGKIILGVLRGSALDSGLDIITCLCPLSQTEKIEHLIIPSLSLAFCTSNSFHRIKNASRRIHARRFTDLKKLSENKQKITFNKKTVRELMKCASSCMRNAKKIHDSLEECYKNAMDFKKVDKIKKKLFNEIDE